MSKLPEDFQDIEARWSQWIIEHEPDRVRMREAAPVEELRAFYDDLLPRIDAILAYLDAFPVNDLPHRELNLWWLMASFAGVGMTVELYASQKAIPGGYILPDVTILEKWDSHKLLQ